MNVYIVIKIFFPIYEFSSIFKVPISRNTNFFISPFSITIADLSWLIPHLQIFRILNSHRVSGMKSAVLITINPWVTTFTLSEDRSFRIYWIRIWCTLTTFSTCLWKTCSRIGNYSRSTDISFSSFIPTLLRLTNALFQISWITKGKRLSCCYRHISHTVACTWSCIVATCPIFALKVTWTSSITNTVLRIAIVSWVTEKTWVTPFLEAIALFSFR